jgi:hypothetical protein
VGKLISKRFVVVVVVAAAAFAATAAAVLQLQTIAYRQN